MELFEYLLLYIDIDECTSGNNCSVNAFCTNVNGSYYCTCNIGFQGDGSDCSGV